MGARALAQGQLKRLARSRKEAQAEATAYVVGRHLGLAHPFATGYLQSWQVLTPADLERELAAVVRASGHIIDRQDGGTRGEQQAEGGDAAA